jgi:hypothetical protein
MMKFSPLDVHCKNSDYSLSDVGLFDELYIMLLEEDSHSDNGSNVIVNSGGYIL